MRKCDHQQALDDSERAIQFEPELAMAYVNRGHALAALGRASDAEASFHEALEMSAAPEVRDEALRALERLSTERGDGAA